LRCIEARELPQDREDHVNHPTHDQNARAGQRQRRHNAEINEFENRPSNFAWFQVLAPFSAAFMTEEKTSLQAEFRRNPVSAWRDTKKLRGIIA
jgi:hypothetical protein